MTLESHSGSIAAAAYDHIYGIVASHFEDAVLEVGNYLVLTFYNDDYARARANQPIDSDAFLNLNQLISAKRIQDPGSPSKTWIYNSLKLVCDANALEGYEPYEDLNISLKTALLPVKDLGEKKQLISRIAEEQMTVRQVREYLAGNPEPKISILDLPPPEELSAFSPETLLSLKTRAVQEIKKLKTKTDQYKDVLVDIELALDNAPEEDNASEEETAPEE